MSGNAYLRGQHDAATPSHDGGTVVVQFVSGGTERAAWGVTLLSSYELVRPRAGASGARGDTQAIERPTWCPYPRGRSRYAGGPATAPARATASSHSSA